MKHLEIYYCDFYAGFDPYSSLSYKILSEQYDVNITSKPSTATDICIYSCFGTMHKSVKCCKKLYWSGENDFPDFNECDYAVTHNAFEHERHMRLPLWVLYDFHNKKDFINKPNLDESAFDRKFCADVISNTDFAWPVRQNLIKAICNYYKDIDHGGQVNNNVGGLVEDKIEFLSKYKFSIAAENSDVEGYVTEKIYDAFCADTIPIYLGSTKVTDDFNKEAFINVRDFPSYDDLFARIKQIDENKDLYMQIINSPRLAKADLIDEYNNKLRSFLFKIADNGKVFCHKYGRIGIINSNNR